MIIRAAAALRIFGEVDLQFGGFGLHLLGDLVCRAGECFVIMLLDLGDE